MGLHNSQDFGVAEPGVAGIGHELFRQVGDRREPRCGPGDDRSPAPSHFEQPLVSEGLKRPQQRVNIHAEALGQVAGRRQFLARTGVAVGDRLPELTGDLFV